MRELIDKHDAYMMLKAKAESYAKAASYHHYDHEEAYTNAARIIDSMPTIEAEPVLHGGWILGMNGNFVCSQCRHPQQIGSKDFCGKCGARMDVGAYAELGGK